ncbi:ABC transporter substrate-binding protein, partial [Burkholderia cenocepacia]
AGAAMEGAVPAYQRNLAKLGIAVRFRTADYALLQKRLDAFDYDMTTIRLPGVQVPSACSSASTAGDFNPMKLSEPGSSANLLA